MQLIMMQTLTSLKLELCSVHVSWLRATKTPKFSLVLQALMLSWQGSCEIASCFVSKFGLIASAWCILLQNLWAQTYGPIARLATVCP